MAPKKQAAKKEVEPKKKETKATKGVEKKTKAKKEPTKVEPKKAKSPKKAETAAAAAEPEVPAKTAPAKKSAPKKEAKTKTEKPAAKKSAAKSKAVEKDQVTKTKAAPKTKKEPKSPKKEPKSPKKAPSSPKKEPKSPKSPKKAAETKAENGKAETLKEAKSSDKLVVGEPIFEFELETDASTDSSPDKVSITEVLKDYGVVIFFFPKANTPGCTKQACGFRDDFDEYVKAGYKIFGLSADKPKSQKSWKDKQGFQYTLLSDPTFEILSKLGVASGKKITRSHIIIEKGNKVKDISIGVNPADSVANVKAAIL